MIDMYKKMYIIYIKTIVKNNYYKIVMIKDLLMKIIKFNKMMVEKQN